jgi:hypothetical protein
VPLRQREHPQSARERGAAAGQEHPRAADGSERDRREGLVERLGPARGEIEDDEGVAAEGADGEDAPVLQHRVPAEAEGPERSSVLGRLLVHGDDGTAVDRDAHEVPPAAPVADREEGVVVEPLGLEHGLGDRPGEHARGTRPAGVGEVGDPELGAVPGHLRMLPGDIGQSSAVGREPRVGDEAGSADDRPDARQVGGGGPVEGHGHDVARHRPGPVRLAHGDHLVAADAQLAEAGLAARLGRDRGEGHRRRGALVEAVEPLVAELREDEGAGIRHGPGAAAVLVHAGAGVPGLRQHVDRCAVRPGPPHGEPSALVGPLLEPPHLVADPGPAGDRMPLARELPRGDRRDPGSVGGRGHHGTTGPETISTGARNTAPVRTRTGAGTGTGPPGDSGGADRVAGASSLGRRREGLPAGPGVALRRAGRQAGEERRGPRTPRRHGAVRAAPAPAGATA